RAGAPRRGCAPRRQRGRPRRRARAAGRPVGALAEPRRARELFALDRWAAWRRTFTMMSGIKGFALSLGLTLSLGGAFVPLGCGSSGGAGYDRVVPTHRGPPEVPAPVVAQLTDCVKQAAAPFPPAEGNKYAIHFNVHASKGGRVGAVEVEGSTLGGN